jgi:hypothetical protein
MIGAYEIIMILFAACDLIIAIYAVHIMKKGIAARSLRE